MSETDIKLHLDTAIDTQSTLICVLKEGLTETEHIYDDNPVLYKQIQFQPYAYYRGCYTGLIFFPNGKSQGLMDLDAASFESIISYE